MKHRSSKSNPRRTSKKTSEPDSADQLAKDLGVRREDTDQFNRSVNDQLSDDQVVLSKPQATVLPPPGREMVGSFQLNQRGFGFIIPDTPIEHGDLFVPAGNTGGALTGDHVRARVIHQKSRGGGSKSGRSPYIGEVIEVIQRGNQCFTGNLKKRGQVWVVQVDGKILHDPIIIRDPHAKDAKEGDKVVIEISDYPTDDEPGEGVIIEVLGESGQPHTETLAVIRAFGLPGQFPPEVIAQARAAAASFDETTPRSNREDLTKQLICTIDPPDAKDFDDAISIDRFDPHDQDDGAAYELGIHIADVSYFVTQDSELDKEAYTRGNSAYLPKKVVPMLPELLSNGVCSLQEGVDRFCKSAFVRYDERGHVISERLANTVIHSAKRLTYIEAQALIEDDLRLARKHTRSTPKYSRALIDKLKLMDELARLLRQRRIKDGMITLALPDVELVFDEHGFVVDATPEDNAFTHTIIEMFMVEANEAIARFFDRLQVPCIRRIHPDPDVSDLSDLRRYVRVAGYNVPDNPTRIELQQLLNSARGKPAEYAVNIAVLKTLSKAEYSPQPIGHFALASKQYVHFTSPIRRYPDLTAHRSLDACLEHAGNDPKGGRKKKINLQRLLDDPRCPDEQSLTETGRHCSSTERNAESAERNLRTFFVLELLSHKLGEDFEGTVTGVTNSGVYVQINRYLVDGFIPVNDLPSHGSGTDRWRLNRATGALVAQRSGKTITIGDQFVVRIATVKPAGRVLELAIVDGRPSKSQKRSQPRGARKAFQETLELKRAKNKAKSTHKNNDINKSKSKAKSKKKDRRKRKR